MKNMPRENSENYGSCHIGTNDDPVVSHVEIGVAKLNTVSHHEHLRCAKYVNPLVRQLSAAPGKDTPNESTVTYNRNSLIVLDAELVDSDPENDVYEDQMETELESSYENCLVPDNLEESDTTLSDNNSEYDGNNQKLGRETSDSDDGSCDKFEPVDRKVTDNLNKAAVCIEVAELSTDAIGVSIGKHTLDTAANGNDNCHICISDLSDLSNTTNKSDCSEMQESQIESSVTMFDKLNNNIDQEMESVSNEAEHKDDEECQLKYSQAENDDMKSDLELLETGVVRNQLRSTLVETGLSRVLENPVNSHSEVLRSHDGGRADVIQGLCDNINEISTTNVQTDNEKVKKENNILEEMVSINSKAESQLKATVDKAEGNAEYMEVIVHIVIFVN